MTKAPACGSCTTCLAPLSKSRGAAAADVKRGRNLNRHCSRLMAAPGVGRNGSPNMLLTTYIRPKRLTWRVTFGLGDLPGGLPRRPEAAGGPGRRFAMSILTIRFIPGLVWHNFWHLPLQPCVARAGCCGHAPVHTPNKHYVKPSNLN